MTDNYFNIIQDQDLAEALGCSYESEMIPGNPQGIYVIEKVYVGRSLGIRERLRQHFQEAIRGVHSNQELSKILKTIVANKGCINVIWVPLSSDNDQESRCISFLVENGCKLLNKKNNLITRRSRGTPPESINQTPLTIQELEEMIRRIAKSELKQAILDILG